MKLNIIFLVVGLILSIASKIFQFKIKSKRIVGDIIIMPAAICFVIAILLSIDKFCSMFFSNDSQQNAILLAVSACVTVVSFQLIMLLIIVRKKMYGLLFLIPFMIGILIFAHVWILS
jgi:hypothetical protein